MLINTYVKDENVSEGVEPVKLNEFTLKLAQTIPRSKRQRRKRFLSSGSEQSNPSTSLHKFVPFPFFGDMGRDEGLLNSNSQHNFDVSGVSHKLPIYYLPR